MKKHFQQFLFGTSLNDNRVLNIAWLLFRVQLGLSIAIHAGFPKLEDGLAPGWFINQVSGLGFNFPSASFWAAVAVWGEFAGGILIAIGLFTRFSALQLAFQFFVISFLWYDNPEPFTGMYFQHSLFWGFVLISFVGGGQYSIDKLIMSKRFKQVSLNPKPAAALLILLLGLGFSSFAQKVAKDDFKPVIGKWNGTLTYLDYTSGQPYTMPANITVLENSKDALQLIFVFEYPKEPKANGNDTLTISADGTMINNARLNSKENKAGTIVIIADRDGIDGNDNKKAVIRYIYTFNARSFSKRKEVRFDGEEKWIMRNEYKMIR